MILYVKKKFFFFILKLYNKYFLIQFQVLIISFFIKFFH